MKPIEKDELFDHLSQFLKTKGIEMKEGSYTTGIQKGCTLLADAINVSQKGIKRARTEINKKLERMRQVIHEKTAPKASRAGDVSKSQGTKAKAGARTPKGKAAKSESRKVASRGRGKA
jgi:hypothetical protein